MEGGVFEGVWMGRWVVGEGGGEGGEGFRSHRCRGSLYA